MQPMEKPTRQLIKTVKSLGTARHRREHGLFKAEGTKCVADTLGHFALRHLLATDAWLADHEPLTAGCPVVKCTRDELERMTSMSTAPEVIAVYEIPADVPDINSMAEGQLVIALDSLQDPGNLGTIMRIADWFGITLILASKDTVDIYNPKSVQATMGAISRVRVAYVDLAATLKVLGRHMPVVGTFLNGENIYTADLPQACVVVTGNEGRGISPEIEALTSRRVTIPSYPAGRPTSESLNAAMATAITVSTIRGRSFNQPQ